MALDWWEKIVDPFYPVSLPENQPADLEEIEKSVFLIEMDLYLKDTQVKRLLS